MPTIVIETFIHAPVELSIWREMWTLTPNQRHSPQNASWSLGRTHGLLVVGDIVAFEGRHFGMKQRFVARITALDRPQRFIDEMIQGAFKGSARARIRIQKWRNYDARYPRVGTALRFYRSSRRLSLFASSHALVR